MESSNPSIAATLGSADAAVRPLPPPNRRRDKPQLSCTLCRKRKLKCDRGQPCEACTKRGLSLSCTYVPVNQPLEQPEKTKPKPVVYLQMKDKIAQLENLVFSQMQKDDISIEQALEGDQHESNSPPSQLCAVSGQPSKQEMPSQAILGPSAPLRRLSVGTTATTAIERTNWRTILESISTLKESLETYDEVNEDSDAEAQSAFLDGPELLLRGCCKAMEKPQILSAIPPRQAVNQLISTFFKSVEIAPVMLHSPTFLTEYEQFWDSPERTPILWIGQLFAIMGLALLHQQLQPQKQHSFSHVIGSIQQQIQIFRGKVSQCLVIGKYTKGGPCTLETLLLYTHMECLVETESDSGVWILLGIAIRLALRMSYHRDAGDSRHISSFQAEMRRRVWAVLFMMDATMSARFGLARMIRASQCDVQEPRNLLDEDIWKDITPLPPARPESIQTPVQYFVAKNRLVSVSAKVTDLLSLIQRPQYTEVLRIDGMLHKAFDSIPSCLVMRSMTQSIMDSPKLIMQRILVALIYYKAKCILHRPFSLGAQRDTIYIYSRTACLEAALEILKFQQIIDQETKIGGRLNYIKGEIPLSVKKDFLYATIILCADINQGFSENTTIQLQHPKHRHTLDENLLETLDAAYSIWSFSSDSSREAFQATSILEGVLGKVQKWKADHSFSETPRTTSAMSSGDRQVRNKDRPSSSLLSKDPDDVNARLTASNPNFLRFVSANSSKQFLDLPEVDFEMGNWWETENIPSPRLHKPDQDPRTFGWILPGGGNYDAF